MIINNIIMIITINIIINMQSKIITQPTFCRSYKELALLMLVVIMGMLIFRLVLMMMMVMVKMIVMVMMIMMVMMIVMMMM